MRAEGRGQCPRGCGDSWAWGAAPCRSDTPGLSPRDEVVLDCGGKDSNGSVLPEWREWGHQPQLVLVRNGRGQHRTAVRFNTDQQ